MANTIAKATGGDATREKTTTRLGSRYASAQANTWRTFATVTTWADGHGRFELTRGDDTIVICFRAEDQFPIQAEIIAGLSHFPRED